MGAELQLDDGAADLVRAAVTVVDAEPSGDGRPNVCGDLPSVLEAAPMFRRAVAGYDRFQVDTYVRWAEDELATAERERMHLERRQLRTQAALDDATRLLSHSPGAGEFLRLSSRIGSMLAAAADEAESIRGEAEADRAVAAAQVEELAARADRVLADARAEAERAAAEAERVVAEAAIEVERMAAEAAQLVAAAERAAAETRAAAAARLDEVRVLEQRAADSAGQTRRRAVEEGNATLLRARDEVVRMLDTAREERRRADVEAAAARARLDRDAVTRTTSLRADVAALAAEVAALENRRSALRSEIDVLAGAPTPATGDPLEVQLRRIGDRFRRRSGSLRAP